MPRHSLKALVDYFFGEKFDAHNAVEDAKILQRLFYDWKPSDPYVNKFTFWP